MPCNLPGFSAAILCLTLSAPAQPGPEVEQGLLIERNEAFQRGFPEVLREKGGLTERYRVLLSFAEEAKLDGLPKWRIAEQVFRFLIDEGYAANDPGFVVFRAVAVATTWLDVSAPVWADVLLPYWDHEDPATRKLAQEMLEASGFLGRPDDPRTWSVLAQYLRRAEVAEHPARIPPGFWRRVFSMNPGSALNMTMKLPTLAGKLDREEESFIDETRTAIHRPDLTFTEDNRARAEPESIRLLGQLALHERWDVKLYVVSMMDIRPSLNRPYYDRAVLERLADDENHAVREGAAYLLKIGPDALE